MPWASIPAYIKHHIPRFRQIVAAMPRVGSGVATPPNSTTNRIRVLVAVILVAVILVLIAGIVIKIVSPPYNPLAIVADFVPAVISIVAVLISFIPSNRRTAAIVLMVVVGIIGSVFVSWNRQINDDSHKKENDFHKQEIQVLNDKLDALLRQNTATLNETASEPQQVAQRKKILSLLRNEYIISHPSVSAGILTGAQTPPANWMNERLKALGQRWRVTDDDTITKLEPAADPEIKLLRKAETLYRSLRGWHTSRIQQREAAEKRQETNNKERGLDAQTSAAFMVKIDSNWWDDTLLDYQQTYASELIRLRRDMLAVVPEAGANSDNWEHPGNSGAITGIWRDFEHTITLLRLKLRKEGKLKEPITQDEQYESGGVQ